MPTWPAGTFDFLSSDQLRYLISDPGSFAQDYRDMWVYETVMQEQPREVRGWDPYYSSQEYQDAIHRALEDANVAVDWNAGFFVGLNRQGLELRVVEGDSVGRNGPQMAPEPQEVSEDQLTYPHPSFIFKRENTREESRQEGRREGEEVHQEGRAARGEYDPYTQTYTDAVVFIGHPADENRRESRRLQEAFEEQHRREVSAILHGVNRVAQGTRCPPWPRTSSFVEPRTDHES